MEKTFATIIATFMVTCILVTIVAANSIETTTIVVPATPKKTVTLALRSMMGIENEIKSKIDVYTSQGYIVKVVAISEDESTAKAIVVLEKY